MTHLGIARRCDRPGHDRDKHSSVRRAVAHALWWPAADHVVGRGASGWNPIQGFGPAMRPFPERPGR